jgi:hypothetical protein
MHRQARKLRQNARLKRRNPVASLVIAAVND